jgi:protein-L-isoaspartate(D-aspartate) O-methyltransferase
VPDLRFSGIGMTSARTRDRLVQRLREQGIANLAVLDRVRNVPRHIFVDEALGSRAYEDTALPIGFGQTISQPYIVARMTEALLEAGPAENVLEVGTGCGYQTALLAMLAREIWSVELWPDMTEGARAALTTVGIENVTLLVGDGTLGLPDRAPFDAIVVTAAFPTVPSPLADQLAEGGRLVQPIGPGGREDVRLFEKRGESLEVERSVTGAYFVPLYGQHAYPLEQAPAQP